MRRHARWMAGRLLSPAIHPKTSLWTLFIPGVVYVMDSVSGWAESGRACASGGAASRSVVIRDGKALSPVPSVGFRLLCNPGVDLLAHAWDQRIALIESLELCQEQGNHIVLYWRVLGSSKGVLIALQGHGHIRGHIRGVEEACGLV